MGDSLAQKLGLAGAKPPTAATPAEAPPAPVPRDAAAELASDQSAFGKMLANELTLGGSPGATARGAQLSGWMQSMFGPKEEIPREYRGGSEQADVEQNVRADLATQRREHPKSALAADVVAAADHAALAAGLPGAPAGAGWLARIGTGALQGAAMGGAEAGLRARNANAPVLPAVEQGAVIGGVGGGGVSTATELPAAFRFLRNAARGTALGGAGAGRAARKLAENRAGIRTAADVGQAAEDLGLPSASKGPMSAHDFQEAAQDVQNTAGPRIDQAVREAGAAPPTPPPAGLPNLPPPTPEAVAAGAQPIPGNGPLELRNGVRSSGKVTIDMRPDAAEHVEHLPDAVYPARPAPTTVRPGRPAGAPPTPPALPGAAPPASVPATERFAVPKSEIRAEMQRLLDASANKVDAPSRAYRAELRRQIRELDALPGGSLTPERVLEMRRGLDQATRFERAPDTKVSGGARAAGDVGKYVRGKLNETMAKTPQGPEFAKANEQYSKAAVLESLARMKAQKQSAGHVLGTGLAGAAAGGAMHGYQHGGEKGYDVTDSLLPAAAAGGLAALGSRYGADTAAMGFKGAEKVTSGVAEITKRLPPGAAPGILDIWAVKEKQKNETDPKYRQQQRESAEKSKD